jgi:chromosome segregation ATPase
VAKKQIWIQNASNVDITAKVKDPATGGVILEKTFRAAAEDKWTGRVIKTGYTPLTEEEYEQLEASSALFRHFKDDLHKLVVCEDLPAEAKTPHEALRDARKDAKKADAELAKAQEDITTLKAALHDAETKYKELQSASTPEEALATFNEKLGALESENAALTAKCEAYEKTLAAMEKKLKKGGGKEFE